MKRLLISASLAGSVLIPSAALAQAIPAAVVAVVDLDKVTTNCNACKTASNSLRSQVNSLQTRQQALAAPLEAEQKAIQTAIDAAGNKEPDATLQARIKTFQARQAQGSEELQNQEAQIKRNQQYVQRQIAEKLGPIYSQVMQRRGANVMVEVGSTLATGASLDVTNDIVAALNTALPTLATVAPAQAAQPRPARPQGR